VSSPPDKPLCVELSPAKAYCVNTISGKSFIIDDNNKFEDKTYWEMRPAMILMPASTWKAYKSWIIKTCKKSNKCEESVSSWDRTIENLDVKLDEKSLTK